MERHDDEVNDEVNAVSAVRRRIAEIYDQLRALPLDSFAARAELRTERDGLTAQLRSASTADGGIAGRWAARAARHRPDPATAFLPSHGEGGSSAGSAGGDGGGGGCDGSG